MKIKITSNYKQLKKIGIPHDEAIELAATSIVDAIKVDENYSNLVKVKAIDALQWKSGTWVLSLSSKEYVKISD